MRFKPENRARYFMDFGFWEGLPSDRDFEDCGPTSSGCHILKAPGYGVRGDYGNGSIFIRPEQIARWRKPGS